MSGKPITTHPVNGFQGKGVKNSFCYIPHYYMPGLNTYAMNTINSTDEAIQYYSVPDRFNLPVPYVAFLEIESRINAVSDLVNLKTRWKHQNEKLLKKCREKINLSTLNNIKTAVNRKNTSSVTIPSVLSSFTSNLMENPDEYFDSVKHKLLLVYKSMQREYNWYFKNTIEKYQINGKWYLACVRGVNLDILDIILINNNKFGTIETREEKFFKGSIFDIKSSNSNELMIRQKTRLFVFLNNFDVESLLNNNSIYDNCDIPLVDADITTNNLCTADVNHIIKLWRDGNCIQEKYFKVEYDQNDSFIHLGYLQNQTNSIAIINRQQFYLIDTRIDISKPCSIYNPSTVLELCEELTALNASNLNTHSVYVASNHSVLTLDNRMGFVHKSYHMLSNPPSLMNTHCYENSLEPNELLFLGNQTGEGLVNLSYNSCQDDFLICQNMVSSIPKPLDALYNVRLQGHCLNPMLLDRFPRCLIGTTALGKHFDNLRLFSVNSAGDLFVQNINESTPIDVTEFKKTVTVKPQTVQQLNYSQTFDMSKLWQLKPLDNNKENIKKNRFWSISKEKMTSYVDHLAPLILSPWDIDDLSEWENEDEDNDADNDDSDCDYTTKVHYWFNKNDSLLGSAEPFEPNTNEPLIHFTSQATSIKPPSTSEKDEDSSSGFSVSLKSDF